jgi:hypothetical protein
MDVTALLDEFRNRIEDTDRDDPLWSDEEIYFYMNSAQRMFARLTEIFVSSYPNTPAITEAAITANSAWVPISPLIIKIRRALLGSDNRKLALKRVGELDAGYFLSDDYGFQQIVKWDDETGTPTTAVTDMEKDNLRLVPIHTVNDTLRMTVVRFPFEEIEDADSTLEVTDTDDQLSLIDWMKREAFLKHDADTYDKELSDEFELKFRNQMFTRNQDIKRVRRPAGVVRYGGIPF